MRAPAELHHGVQWPACLPAARNPAPLPPTSGTSLPLLLILVPGGSTPKDWPSWNSTPPVSITTSLTSRSLRTAQHSTARQTGFGKGCGRRVGAGWVGGRADKAPPRHRQWCAARPPPNLSGPPSRLISSTRPTNGSLPARPTPCVLSGTGRSSRSTVGVPRRSAARGGHLMPSYWVVLPTVHGSLQAHGGDSSAAGLGSPLRAAAAAAAPPVSNGGGAATTPADRNPKLPREAGACTDAPGAALGRVATPQPMNTRLP